MLFGKPIDHVEHADLQRLINDGVLEKKGLDYKKQLPGGTDADKKELLYDLTSFGNAGGGYVIFGMREEDGIPVEIEGIDKDLIDSEKLRIESLLRDGVEPRIPGIQIHDVSISETKAALIVHIPRSWSAPHMVKFKGASKFYSRNSAGKYALDVAEIRNAFLLSETLAVKMKSFRTERMGKVIANELPVKIPDGPTAIMHVIPFSAFNPGEKHQLYKPENIAECAPFIVGSFNWRINFDGFLVHTPVNAEGDVVTYSQLFTSGIFEVVDARILRDSVIPCNRFEKAVIDSLERYFQVYRNMEITPPVLIMLSLHNVKGHKMPMSAYDFENGDPIDRNTLIIPEVLVDDFNIAPDILMKPIFDAIWNAAGVEASKCYDKNGRWVGMK